MATPLIGTSESIERSRKLIDYVADTGLHVIITGKSAGHHLKPGGCLE
jgi:DNA-binding NtrC family response regulator